jgi:hypothetical protein
MGFDTPAGCGLARGHHYRTNRRILCGVRLFFVQPFDQSCWTGVEALGAAFATGVMVARLRTINAARIKYVIEILHLFSRARCPALLRHMDALTR